MSEIKILADEAGDLVKAIADRLRKEIVGGVLQPGQRIYESQLARNYGVSRAPFREAARILESEHLLVSQANKGFLVRELTVPDLVDLMDTRCCVERHAVRVAMAQPDVGDLIQSLDAITEQIAVHVRNGDREEEAKADFEFHRRIVEHTRNQRLLSIYDELSAELVIAMRMMGFASWLWEMLPEIHRLVVDTIRAGDRQVAEEEIQRHIEMSWSETIQDLERKKASIPITSILQNIN